MKEKLSNYYPNDLTHGILAAHCADETGINAGFSEVKKGSEVAFSHDNALYKFYKNRKSETLDLNEYIQGWKALEVIDDDQTGYLGIIYSNDEHKQLVLAHRSTNFELGFKTKNFFLQSGVQTDIESVLKGHIVNHQAYGYLATAIAVNLAKEFDCALSITGHSLGAWLAELSIFYCNTDLKYQNVKGVTFDGPGSLEMIEQMSSSNITQFNPESLDVVSYLSPPNIVNCTNKHIGTVYRLFPDIEETGPNLLRRIIGDKNQDALISTYGHDLKYILPYFNIDNGRPEKYQQIKKWPSIKHREFGSTTSTNYNLLNLFKALLPDNLLIKLGINLVQSVVSRLVGNEMTTLGSIATLVYDIVNGKIDQEQFWTAHRYLDKKIGYKQVVDNEIEKFALLYKGHYQVEEHKRYERKIIDNIDKELVSLAKYAAKNLVTDSKIYRIIEKYEYSKDLFKGKVISVKSYYQGFVVVDDLRDALRELLHRNSENFKRFNYDKKIDKLLKNILISNNEVTDILKHLSYFNPDEDIPAEICNQLFNDYQNNIQKWLSDNFIISISKNQHDTIKISYKIQNQVQKYINESEKQNIIKNLLKVLDVMPIVTEHPNDKWDNAKLYNNHAQKLLSYIKELPHFFHENKEVFEYNAKLNTKLGLFYKYVLIDLKKSSEYFLNALASNGKLCNNQNHPDFADSFHNVALSYMKLGKFEEALLYIDQALQQKESLYGTDSIKFADSLDCKGILYEKLYKPTEAMVFIKKALEIRNKFYSKQDHQDIAHSYNNLALKHLADENFAEALYNQIQALEMMKRLYISDTPAFANCWHNLGIIYIKIDETEQAFECLKKSLVIRKKLYGYKAVHHEIASSLENIGIAYQASGEREVGLKWQEEGHKIIEQLSQDCLTIDLANSKNNLGLAYIACKKVDEGLKLLKEALLIKQVLYNDSTSIEIASSLSNIAVAYKKLGNFEKSLEYKLKSDEIFKQVYIAQSYNNIFDCKALVDSKKDSSSLLDNKLQFTTQTLVNMVRIEYDNPILNSLNSNLLHKVKESLKISTECLIERSNTLVCGGLLNELQEFVNTSDVQALCILLGDSCSDGI